MGGGGGSRPVFHAAHSAHDSNEEDAAIRLFFYVVHSYSVVSTVCTKTKGGQKYYQSELFYSVECRWAFYFNGILDWKED